MRKIIADSSSLILLYKCGAADYFFNCCCCIVPEAVMDELTAAGYAGSDFFRQCLISGSITVTSHSGDPVLCEKLHKGERGVISLYKGGAGEYVLIDDGRGAAFCRDNSIPYINALLAVKILFFSGKISEEDYTLMFAWLKSNGRYSSAVIDWAENTGSEVLREFFL